MENPPFEDVFPIQDGDFPASYVCLPEGSHWLILLGWAPRVRVQQPGHRVAERHAMQKTVSRCCLAK